MDRQIYSVLASVQFVLSAADLPAQISLLPSIRIVSFICLSKNLYTGKDMNKYACN